MFHAKTMRFRYRFLHKRRCYFMGLVFQSSFPLYYAFLWCWFVSVWVCKCVRVSVIKCVRSYMHPCSMPRPLGSNTGSCTNVAAILWVFQFFFLFVWCLLMMLVCKSVTVWLCKCLRPYMHPCSMPRPLDSDTGSCTNAAANFYGWVVQSSFPFCPVFFYDAGFWVCVCVPFQKK